MANDSIAMNPFCWPFFTSDETKPEPNEAQFNQNEAILMAFPVLREWIWNGSFSTKGEQMSYVGRA